MFLKCPSALQMVSQPSRAVVFPEFYGFCQSLYPHSQAIAICFRVFVAFRSQVNLKTHLCIKRHKLFCIDVHFNYELWGRAWANCQSLHVNCLRMWLWANFDMFQLVHLQKCKNEIFVYDFVRAQWAKKMKKKNMQKWLPICQYAAMYTNMQKCKNDSGYAIMQ